MRNGDPGGSGGGDARGDPGDHLTRDAVPREIRRLLRAPAEQIWVAALEPHHEPPFPGLGDEQFVGLVLGQAVLPGAFAGVDQLRVIGRFVQQARVRQRVVNHNIGLT